jgi:hypothetical protein
MTSTSLHVQWPLTSQLHDNFLKENNCFFVTDQTPHTVITFVNFRNNNAYLVQSDSYAMIENLLHAVAGIKTLGLLLKRQTQ